MILDNEKNTTTKIEELTCPIRYALDIVGGKWKLPIICMLAVDNPIRYSSIKRKLDGITNTMLAQSLKDLESDGIINRKQYNEIPPKVEYTLTSKGKSIVPILQQFANWGAINMQEKSICGLNCKECRKIK
ncbi:MULTISPECIES: winged helix-turn-helix transcriptional regulator [Clostridioides]|uniref:winged helix-turn-helix transcriptional regulator n=1 Tax=Clostridioides sp. ZZV14-6387 TaxID=2811497 RepID=UPI0007BAF125|nr:helix-turn-helix transcriptional regulator [Clostridioides sp. ZZV14-6387]MDI0267001.1 helix-turn-helix domain-containing protein [Clostridioides difficile]NJI81803.1 helix-turn-helix transcriptional regulator [Clostridioides difficile]CZR95583.1 putative HTH-type transcriptional regulator YybR [Clostridioides difficile]CZS07926.1 putative HTH-type transcriptional regulator YybR [Clostridioides difficile]